MTALATWAQTLIGIANIVLTEGHGTVARGFHQLYLASFDSPAGSVRPTTATYHPCRARLLSVHRTPPSRRTGVGMTHMVTVLNPLGNHPRAVAFAGPDVPTTREERDRIRAAFLNTWRREPGVPAASASYRNRGGIEDLAVAAAILIWESELPPDARFWTYYGAVGLDGSVVGGVVSSGLTARPVDRLADLPVVVAGMLNDMAVDA